jgi:hypothetical protein
LVCKLNEGFLEIPQKAQGFPTATTAAIHYQCREQAEFVLAFVLRGILRLRDVRSTAVSGRTILPN